jgi:hypothetical protein
MVIAFTSSRARCRLEPENHPQSGGIPLTATAK